MLLEVASRAEGKQSFVIDTSWLDEMLASFSAVLNCVYLLLTDKATLFGSI